jgi:hypothetical protein
MYALMLPVMYGCEGAARLNRQFVPAALPMMYCPGVKADPASVSATPAVFTSVKVVEVDALHKNVPLFAA